MANENIIDDRPYQVVMESLMRHLVDKCNELAVRGYKPQGGVRQHDIEGHYYQVMYKEIK